MDPDRTTLNIMLWNVEGLRKLLETAPGNLWTEMDIIIVTETMTTENLEIPQFYSKHALATPKE